MNPDSHFTHPSLFLAYQSSLKNPLNLTFNTNMEAHPNSIPEHQTYPQMSHPQLNMTRLPLNELDVPLTATFPQFQPQQLTTGYRPLDATDFYLFSQDLEKNAFNSLNRFSGGLVGKPRAEFMQPNPQIHHDETALHFSFEPALHDEQTHISSAQEGPADFQSAFLQSRAGYPNNFFNPFLQYPGPIQLPVPHGISQIPFQVNPQANPTQNLRPQNEVSEVPKEGLRKVQARVIEGKIWTEENDQLLLRLAVQYKCDWKKVSRKFKKRNKKVTPNFLKIRYKELIAAPVHRRTKFSHVEDLMLAKYFNQYGPNWNQIASHFKKRTGIMLKNRYYSYIKKKNLLPALLEESSTFEREGKSLEDAYEEDNISQTFEVYVDEENQIVDHPPFHDEIECNPEDEQEEGQEANERSQGNLSSSPEENQTVSEKQEECQDLKKNVDREALFVKSQETTCESNTHTEGQSEVDLLRARVKLLESLFMNAQNELQQLKQNLNNK